MKSVIERLKEPSTHAGLASMASGLGMILHSPETTQIAATIPDVATRLVSHDFIGAAMILFGSLAVVMKERK